MRLKFHCDVPIVNYWGMTPVSLFAYTAPPSYACPDNHRRITFEVDMPPNVLMNGEATGEAKVIGVPEVAHD